MTKKKSVTLGIITFIVTLIITAALAGVYVYTTTNTRKERANFIVESFADKIEAEINSRENVTRVFEIQLTGNDGELSQQDFGTIADALFDDYLDIVDITLAQDGVVGFIYPAGAAERLGVDLFKESRDGIFADYSKISKVPVIIAPTTLDDGAEVMIIRRPVFLNDESFWGFSSVTIGQNAFLSDVNLRSLADQGYEYKLIANNPITGENKVISEWSGKELASPIGSMISTVGGSFWALEISPMAGWIKLYELFIVGAIALIISTLAAMFMYAYMNMKANAKELEVLSYRDALTNLYNPRSYHEHMEELSSKKLPYGIIYMDLNDFKMVNDTYGHETGDGLLNVVAKRLQNSIRERDKAFRIGGDEFVVVIHGTHDKKFYEGVISRMRENVARDVVLGDVHLKVSISAGYARCPEDGTKLEDVVKKADDAMYYNKRLLKARRAQEGNNGSR